MQIRSCQARAFSPRADPSDHDQPDGRVKKTQIAGIGGDDLLPRAARADHHMGIDDVRCSARREQPADIGRVHSAEVDNVGRRLSDQARQPGLPVRRPDRLGQCGRRNGDAGACLTCAGKEDHHTAVIPVQGDQASRGSAETESGCAQSAMARPLTMAWATGEGSEPSSAKPRGALTAGWAIIRGPAPRCGQVAVCTMNG